MFDLSARAQEIRERLLAFMREVVEPGEREYHAHVAAEGQRWTIPPVMEEMKRKAKAAGLWNLFLPDSRHGAGLTNLDYARLAEIMGRSLIASEVFNCSAPDTGNMEVLHLYGNEFQKEQWLEPLLAGEIRSGFAMTEPDVASSDATNIRCRILREGDHYRISGRKWWTTGAMDPRCKFFIVMGETNPEAKPYARQSMVIVPRDTPGVRIVRPLHVFGFDDAPHRDQRLGQVVVCFGERRRVLRCCRTVANRFLGTTAFQQQQATVGERDGAVRILFDGVRETLSGGGVVPLCLVDEAKIIERHRLRRVAPERARNLNGRLRQLPALVVADPQIVPRGGMLRRMSEQFAIQALGVIDLSGLMQRHCAFEFCLGWQG